jgi:manganese transport protein
MVDKSTPSCRQATTITSLQASVVQHAEREPVAHFRPSGRLPEHRCSRANSPPTSPPRALSAAPEPSPKRPVSTTLGMLGPAFVAAVAYVDPGNFATNFEGGARFGYSLLWVVVSANLMAMLVQYLSAKLGIVSRRSLPELCREHSPRWLSRCLWVQAEVIAMATDIAEFVGAALGLNLLFGISLLPAGIITGVIALALLDLQRRGYRRFELAIAGLLGLVFFGFAFELLKIAPSASASAGGLVPHLGSGQELYLAVGIIGATVMPHAIYLHSALTQERALTGIETSVTRLLRFTRLDVIIALSLAGTINIAMLTTAAKLLHSRSARTVDTIAGAHDAIGELVGGTAALMFAVALLAAGVSSSSVGTYAGQVVMSGLTSLRIPLMLRRLVTMAPALTVLALGVNPTSALVFSQVALSFGIPFALVPLVIFTSRRDIMGSHVNRRLTSRFAWAVTVLISALNVFLVYQQFSQ